ncbi:MAG: Rhomboid family intrarane serine protease [Actinomycetota bacterium]|nr:Rhomboid family intrarane serine protease [Actinomycetota bacterium]
MTEPTVLPGCYRHPDRATGIRCTRCERPICTECMIAAPVGFQCPECVAGAAAQTRQATTIAGGALIGRPMVTYTLIGINLAVFLVQFTVGINAVAGDYGMWPVGIAVGGEWWRLVTAAFLHGSFLHIAFNMYVLFALGPTLERILGHSRYLILYVLAAIGGGVASYVFSDMRTVSVGASGAIFGLMGALVVAGRRLRYDVTQVLVLLGINVVIGFIASGVDWRAHLGGLVTGALVAAIMVLPSPRHRMAVQVGGILALLGVMAVLVMWRTAQIQDVLAPLGAFTI